MSRALGFFYVLLAGIGFGFIGIFSRIAFRNGMTVGELLSWRFTFAALLLWAGILIFRPQLIRITREKLITSILLGTFGYPIFSTLYFKSIESVSVPLAALLLFTFPIFVSLGAHFFLKERMTSRQVLSLLLSCVGLGILLWGPLSVRSPVGVLFGLGAAIAYSCYVLLSSKFQKQTHPLSSSLYVISSSAVVSFLFHQPSPLGPIHWNLIQISCVLGLSVVSTIGPLTFFLAGLQKMPSSQASIVVMIEPVVAAFAAGLLLGEKLTNFQLIGAVIVLAALILNTVERKIKPAPLV